MSWWAFVLLLFPSASFAVERCDVSAETVYTVAEIGLREKNLEPADIEFMISDPERIQDPYAGRARDPDNLYFKQKMQRHLHRVKPEQVPTLQARLRALLNQNALLQNKIAEAVIQTAPIFEPIAVEIDVLIKGSTYRYPPFWHRGKNGELQLGIYDAKDYTLTLTTPSEKFRTIRRDILGDINPIRPTPSGGYFSALSMPDGNLIVAERLGGTARIFVHDFDRKSSFNHQPEAHFPEIQLVHGPGNIPYLIAKSTTAISVFSLENSTFNEVYSVKVAKDATRFTQETVLNTPDGRILILLVEDDRTAHIIDPLARSQRKFQAEKFSDLKSISGVFTGEEDYAVAIEQQTGIYKSRFHFLTGKNQNAQSTAELNTFVGNNVFYVTTEGQPRFAVSTGMRKYDRGLLITATNNLLIFDPTSVPNEPEGWFSQIRNYLGRKPTLKPLLSLDGGDGDAGKPRSLEIPGIVMQVSRETDWNNSKFKVFAPEKSLQPITTGKVENQSVFELKMVFADHGRYYAQFYDDKSTSRIFQITTPSPLSAFEGKFEPLAHVATDKDGTRYMVGRNPDSFHFKLYRVMTKEPGKP